MKTRSLFALWLTLSVLGLPAARAVTYSIIDLGEPVDSSGNHVANWSTKATGVNNSGQVVGRINHPIIAPDQSYNSFHSFLYSGGVMTDISPSAVADNSASAINNAGQVAGSAQFPSSGFLGYVRNTDGSFVYYHTPYGPWNTGNAVAINSSGQVAGVSQIGQYYADGSYGAIGPAGGGYWNFITGVVPNAVGPYGVNLAVNGINDSGAFIGSLAPGGNINTPHAFLHSGGVTTDLGTLGGPTSLAFGLSDSNMVVGESDINGVVHAFSYTPGGGMVDIDGRPPVVNGETYYSHALAVSDTGSIVGYGNFAGGGGEHAFIYTPDMGMLDLNNHYVGSGWQVLQSATAISDNGNYIAGYGINSNGQTHAFLLTATTLSSVPDAGDTLRLMLVALLGLVGLRQYTFRRRSP